MQYLKGKKGAFRRCYGVLQSQKKEKRRLNVRSYLSVEGHSEIGSRLLVIRLQRFTKCFSRSGVSEAPLKFLNYLDILFHRRRANLSTAFHNGSTPKANNFPRNCVAKHGEDSSQLEQHVAKLLHTECAR